MKNIILILIAIIFFVGAPDVYAQTNNETREDTRIESREESGIKAFTTQLRDRALLNQKRIFNALKKGSEKNEINLRNKEQEDSQDIKQKSERDLEQKEIEIKARIETKKVEQALKRENRQEELKKKRDARINAYFERMIKRLNAVIARFEKFTERIEGRIKKFEERSINVEKAKELLVLAQEKIENAKNSISETKVVIEEITTGNNEREAFAKAKNLIQKEVVLEIKEAHRALINVIVMLKANIKTKNTVENEDEEKTDDDTQ